MRILISIFSDHKSRAQSDSQRATWMTLRKNNLAEVDYRIFFGRGGEAQHPDEIILDVDDSYTGLCCKTHAIVQWAFERGYDFIFNASNDCYLRIDRLLSSNFREHDYTGFGCLSNTKPTLPGDEHQLYAHGGCGYILSRKGMAAILKQEPIEGEAAEDWFVGRACQLAKVPLYPDMRYQDLKVFSFGGIDYDNVISSAEHIGWQMWTEHRRYLGLRLLNEPPSKHIEKV